MSTSFAFLCPSSAILRILLSFREIMAISDAAKNALTKISTTSNRIWSNKLPAGSGSEGMWKYFPFLHMGGVSVRRYVSARRPGRRDKFNRSRPPRALLKPCQAKNSVKREKIVRIIISGFGLPVNRPQTRTDGLRTRKSAVRRDFRGRTVPEGKYRLFWDYTAFAKVPGKEFEKTFQKPAVLWFTVGGKSGSITDGFFMLNASRSAGFFFCGNAGGFFSQTNP